MSEQVLIIAALVVLAIIGTYVVHWLLNAQEWVDVYIRKVQPALVKKYPAGSRRAALRRALARRRVIVKTLGYRDKIIDWLAKDNPKLAPYLIYIFMGSALILIMCALVVLSYRWGQLG